MSADLQRALATGAVMAGGRSSRFGQDKALLVLDGETLLARAVRLLGEVTEEQLIVGPPERSAHAGGVRVVTDELPGSGPLGGILTALSSARYDRVLVVACDMPFLQAPLLNFLLSQSDGVDVVLPRLSERGEQLHAVYARSCIEPIRRQLEAGEFKIDRFFQHVRVRIVEEGELRQYDPALDSFRNVNTREDWADAQARLSR